MFKQYIKSTIGLVFISSLLASSVQAQMSSFKKGTVIEGFGKSAAVTTHTVSNDAQFKVAFDVGQAAEGGVVNRKFDSLARFINMHVAAGVDRKNIQLALVVHGKASFDLLDNATYQKLHKQDNPNKPLLQALMANNVQVILCGQTAAAYEIDISQLVEGSEVELSAMTAHALLQQAGYTVNPF